MLSQGNSSTKGFSLVEILVVITIMALLVAVVASSATNILDNSESTACKQNLKEISQNMVLMKHNRKQRGKKAWPKEKGIRFLLELTKHSEKQEGKHSRISGTKTKIFLCPGTDDVNTLEDDPTPGSAYFDLENLDSFSISYAGRNQVDFPIEKDKKGDDAIMAADDNEGRANHKTDTNFVTVDAVVDSVAIEDFLDENPELEWLPVGPDSPYPRFQTLLVDY